MKLGVDTNVLIYAQMPALPQHGRARSYLLDKLQRGDTTLVLTPSILHEFIHLVTDSRRFAPPVGMREALAVARLYLNRPNIVCLAADEASTHLAFDLLERYRLGRRRLADTLFAATLLRNGVRTLLTCNPQDFRVFEGLEVIDPLEFSR